MDIRYQSTFFRRALQDIFAVTNPENQSVFQASNSLPSFHKLLEISTDYPLGCQLSAVDPLSRSVRLTIGPSQTSPPLPLSGVLDWPLSPPFESLAEIPLVARAAVSD